MVSKKRITVNFSYPELHQMIVSQSKRTGSSSSAIIQDMLFDALKKRVDNNEFMPEEKLSRNKNLIPEKFFNQGFEINNLTIDGQIIGGMDGFYRQIKQGRFTVRLGLECFCSVEKTYDAIDKKTILESVSLHLQETLRGVGDDFFTSNLLLVFLGGISVKYQGNNGREMLLDIHYFCKVLPVYGNKKNNDELLTFDLKNIRFRTFRDVATNGWDRIKYSHLLYIKGLKGISGGGYFVGILYDPQSIEDLIAPSEKYYLSISGLNTRYGFFSSPSTVKFIMHTFPHSVSMTPDGNFTVKEKMPHDVSMIHRYTRRSGTSM